MESAYGGFYCFTTMKNKWYNDKDKLDPYYSLSFNYTYVIKNKRNHEHHQQTFKTHILHQLNKVHICYLC